MQNTNMKPIRTLILSFLLLASFPGFSQQPSGTIPDFTFYKLDNTPFTKKQLKNNGKKIMFIFFDITCSHCQEEITDIGKHYQSFKNVEFYMVSMDEVPGIRKFMGSYGKALNGKSNVTVLRDANREFIPRFQPDRYPALFLYTSQGKLIKFFSGEKSAASILKAVKI
ncbi:TlpA family protein disulfide reductase [Rubrolithibacter danxiaensis]|uniref:TlpA family protein disulfide reductase n=1 Tax=Rubrolithibacter danxiaensis TaxID=3390805 RepID=UPI003BF7D55C